MPNILYGVSPIGLGHATRSSVIIRRLAEAGAKLQVFSGGEAAEFLRSQGFEVAGIVADTPPRVSDGRMTWASAWYIRSWLGYRSTIPRTRRLFESFGPSLVVCDEEFTGMSVAGEKGVKRVFISDELELGFAKGWLAGRIEKRVYRWYRQLQSSVDAILIPEDGTDEGNRRYVGPIVRKATADANAARQKYGLPAAGRMVLLSLSGSGLTDHLIERTVAAIRGKARDGLFLVITGNRGTRVESPLVYDLGVVRDNQDLIACSDLVISGAGKSTIDEAASTGTPIIAIPIKNHAEQERNALALGSSSEDLNRIGQLIGERLGRRNAPVLDTGTERATQLILSMA